MDEAFDNFYDEKSDKTFEEMFMTLLNEFTSNAIAIMNRQRKTGQKITDSERTFQEECMDQLKQIDRAVTLGKKNGLYKATAKPIEDAEEDLLTRIRNKPSSMKNLVAVLPIKDDTEDAV